ncbi:NAD(P)-dependent oxidoreductase [Novosphingobium sp. PP1Y]|uniref:NAD(P)-dependent oxidoreductase n=1 Tax=Novosphingobium sp. PP1Y TaxID=702113 RepID=UPI00020EF7E3|nr:NAD(P)-dependent oxidoreductase [Novosphingobium sp. PP1Y]CCA90868.1 6-phosphogluconate dehydrogenase, NAD-binding [Novosphingobium sp. PP1Y]
MNNSIALIGFGEAGSTFARGAQWGDNVRAFDIDPSRREAMDSHGVIACDSIAEALDGARLVLSLVTADAAPEVARAAAALLGEGAIFCDLNSVAPGTKRASAQAVNAGKGRYVDVAVLAPVEPARMKVPLLVSGAEAAKAQELLGEAGFANVRTVGDQVGRASAIKLVRSVMVKGLEALTAEMMMAAHAEGVAQEVLASLDASEKSVGWAERADYNLDRMLIHGRRRAAEMQEAAQMLRSLGIDPLMTDNTVNWQRSLGQLAMTPLPEGYEAKLAGIAATGVFTRGDGK